MYSIRSVKNIMDEILYFISLNKNLKHLFAITESWLADDIQDCVLSIPNYSIIRNDGKLRKGGGVCVWYNNSISFESFTPSSQQPTEIEVLFTALNIFKIVFCLVYIDNINQCLISTYDELLTAWPSYKVTFLGDFNRMNTDILEASCSVVPIITFGTRNDVIIDQLFC